MGLPLPPEDYPSALKLTSVPAGNEWWRIQRCDHATALFWGEREAGRWNDPDGRFGVLYASESVVAAFAETFGRELMATTAPAAVKFLSRLELQERCVSRLWAERELRLLDFGGPALQALNLDARLLHTCDELEVCKYWARWLYGAPEQPDGHYGIGACVKMALGIHLDRDGENSTWPPVHVPTCPLAVAIRPTLKHTNGLE